MLSRRHLLDEVFLLHIMLPPIALKLLTHLLALLPNCNTLEIAERVAEVGSFIAQTLDNNIVFSRSRITI